MRSISKSEIDSTVSEVINLSLSARSESRVIGYLETTLQDVLNRCDEDTRNEMYVRLVDKIVSLRTEIKERESV